MPAKKSPNAKIIDISAPDQTAPDPTSRPVVVTNRPVLASDPMMVEDKASEAESTMLTAPVVSRQAKTITPLDAEDVVEKTETQEADAHETEPEAAADEKTEPTEPAKEETDAKPPKAEPRPEDKEPEAAAEAHEEEPKSEPAAEPEPTEEEIKAHHDATDAKEEEVDTARQNELERLIASGKYFVPINAVQRKRARIIAIVLSVIALLLAIALFDLALDSNALSVPGVPHTNFFRVK